VNKRAAAAPGRRVVSRRTGVTSPI